MSVATEGDKKEKKEDPLPVAYLEEPASIFKSNTRKMCNGNDNENGNNAPPPPRKSDDGRVARNGDARGL